MTRGVPAHSFFNEEAFEGDMKRLGGCNAEEAFALLTLLVNREDRVALRCCCGFGSPSLRKGAWNRLRAYCEETGESPWVALQHLADGTLKLPQTGDLVQRFHELQDRLAQLAGLQGNTLVDAIFPMSDPSVVPLRPSAKPDELDTFDAAKLLDAVRTAVTQPELPTDVDYVRIMSLHKSKGLTADLVVVLECIDGLIPFIPPNLPEKEADAQLQEQRRLFYVAITRARSTLILSGAVRMPIKEAYKFQVHIKQNAGALATTVASRFLAELGPSRPSPVRGEAWLAEIRRVLA